MNTTTLKLKPEDWNPHQEYIRTLYLEEYKSVKQIRDALEKERGLIATISQCNRVINQVWKLKKTFTNADIQYIEREKRKRTYEGKDTVVKIGGRVVGDDEIQRKKARKYQTVFEQQRDRLNQDESTDIDMAHKVPGIEFITPSPTALSPIMPPVQLSTTPTHSQYFPSLSLTRSPSPAAYNQVWPTSFFEENWGDILGLGSPPPSSSSFLTWPESPSHSGAASPIVRIRPIYRYTWMQQFSRNPLLHVMPTWRFQDNIDYIITSYFSSKSMNSPTSQIQLKDILTLKPFKCVEDWQTTNLIRYSNSFSLDLVVNLLKSCMIRLSNNTDKPRVQRQYTDKLLESGIIQNNLDILRAVIQQSKKTARRDGEANSRDSELIVKNFAIQLFYAAARTGNLQTLKFLLQLDILGDISGTTPRTLSNLIGATAIQFAIEYRQEPAFALLVKQGTDLNTLPVSDLSFPLLWTAVAVGDTSILMALVDHGATDRYQSFQKYTELRRKYLSELRNDRLAWAKEFRTPSPFLDITSALNFSISLKRLECYRLLARLCKERYGFSPDIKSKSNIIYIAIEHKAYELLEEIISSVPSTARAKLINKKVMGLLPYCGQIKHTALAWAIVRKDTKAMALLLGHGASARKVDLHTHVCPHHLLESPFKEKLEDLGLRDIVLQLKDAEAQKEAFNDDHSLFGDLENSDYDSEGEERIEWTTRFTELTDNLEELFDLIDKILESNKESREAQMYIKLCLPFLEWLDFDLVDEYGYGSIYTLAQAVFWDQHKCAEFMQKIYFFLYNLQGDSSEVDLNYDGLPTYDRSEPGFLSFRNPISRSKRARLREFVDSYCRTDTWRSRRFCIRNMDLFCCYENKDYEPGESRNKNRGYQRGVYNPAKGERFARRLGPWFEKHIGSAEIQYIFEWALSIRDKNFHKNLCDIGLTHLHKMPRRQVETFLRLAAHCDFHSIVEAIFKNIENIEDSDIVVAEATWFSGMKTFSLIIEQYQLSVLSADQTSHSKVLGLETSLLVAVLLGQTYKVIRLIPYTDLEYELFPGVTLLVVAVELGQLDITKVLLHAGASKYLEACKHRASKARFFILVEVLQEAINQAKTKSRAEMLRKSGVGIPELSQWSQDEIFANFEGYLEDTETGGEYSQEIFKAWTYPGHASYDIDLSPKPDAFDEDD
ncbi:hypothetical protein H072_9070 [Dactylellina haptotyla CBS 200.50]|uniref:Clr5 domain-containing protein n=1 Tax=Dactylellina haptotyla (strain CBS 200.50) TaxID=1284197 RepID=S8BDM9_DACHA|nr:hypothetical protein H072_9070 [Dactylellina haptotyla CBS 200.50]